MEVFYSYSNHTDSIRETFKSVYNDLSCCIIDVDSNDSTNSLELFKKIKYHIDSANIFVCDITSDHILNDVIPLVNSNVILELSYALDKFVNSDIILLYDISKTDKHLIPSMLNGFYITEYESREEDYHLEIVETIKQYLENKKQRLNKDGWVSLEYKLSDVFLKNNLIKCNDYIIRYNKNIKKCVILFKLTNTYIKKIDVMKKQIYINGTPECLSNYGRLYDEIKHLEIIVRQLMI